jgi:hypothetical protein
MLYLSLYLMIYDCFPFCDMFCVCGGGREEGHRIGSLCGTVFLKGCSEEHAQIKLPLLRGLVL